jgi:hypothetical protein
MSAPIIGQRQRWAPPSTAQVDWSHPLAAGLAFAAICCQPSTFVNVVSRARSAASATVASASPWGASYDPSTSGSMVSFDDPSAPASNGWTATMLCKVNSYSSGHLFTRRSSYSASGNNFAIVTHGSSGFCWYKSNLFGDRAVAVSGYAPTGRWAVYVVTSNGSDLVSFYRDGALYSAAAPLGGTAALGSGTGIAWRIGAIDSNAERGNADIAACFFHNRELTAAEVAQLADPFCFLRW